MRNVRDLLLCLPFLATLSGNADAQAIEKPDLTISMGSYSVGYMAAPLTASTGRFAEQGLKVRLENFNRGGTQALQAVLGGSTDMVVGFYDHTIQMQVQNKGLRCVVLMSRLAAVSMTVRSDLAGEIRGVQDFKGRRVGVPSLGSSGDTLFRYVAKRAGLGPKDFTLVAIGNQGTAIAAVEQKQVDIMVASDPAHSILERQGKIKVIIDGRTTEGSKEELGGDYPAACIYATDAFIQSNPVTVQRVVAAVVGTLRWMAASPPAEIVAALPAEYVIGDRPGLAEIVSHYGSVFSPDGRFDPADLERVRDVLSAIDDTGRTAKVDLSKTYTNSFVDAVK